jgi:hypothetical protein
MHIGASSHFEAVRNIERNPGHLCGRSIVQIMESVICEAGEFSLELSGIKDPLGWSGLHVG